MTKRDARPFIHPCRAGCLHRTAQQAEDCWEGEKVGRLLDKIEEQRKSLNDYRTWVGLKPLRKKHSRDSSAHCYICGPAMCVKAK